MTQGPHADPEQVLAHDAFVRGLARQLLRDQHGAEDLAQQTWVAALRRPPVGQHPATLRAWLAAVVRRLAGRRLRGERRHAAREQGAARSELVPSTAEIVARENQRAEVVRAVLELEPSYRDVVLLRFFEQLPPRAIARRMQVPVETVRTRLKRAFALLRTRLDARQGGNRAAWCGLLVPFAGREAPLPALCAGAKSLLTGVLLMSSKTQVAAVATALAGILVVALWVAFAPEQDRGPGSAAPVDQAQALTGKVAAEAAPRAEVGAGLLSREQVVPEAVTATGSLDLQVVFDEDGTPAGDVLVDVWRPGAERLPGHPRMRTDAQGKARFDELRPGKVYAELWRGSHEYGEAVEIHAGRVAQAVLRIAAGMNVRGRVVDGRRRPVAGAEVVTCDWGGGDVHVLAHSVQDGTFAVRAVNTHCHLGARARGFAASALRQFTAGKGAEVEVEVVLQAAAVPLSGKVIDWRGRAVEGAVARAGSEEQRMQNLPEGGRAIGWRPEVAISDAEGAFAFHHLPEGTFPVVVQAPRLAPWRGEVELTAGRAEVITVTLVAGVTLKGTVRNAAGEPVARVDVRVGEGRPGHRDVASSVDGSFRLDGLPVGELQLRASSDQHGDARKTVTAVAGETVVWDVVLDPGLVVKGRVLDADDKPVADVWIEARIDKAKAGERWMVRANSDAAGRFVLKNCPPERALNLQLRRESTFPEMTVKGVQPGGEEVVIRMPKAAWVHIEGSITDPDGMPLPNVHVSPSKKGGGGSPAESADPATGRFRYGPFPPGEYELRLEAAGFPVIRLPWRLLGPDEVWDVGALRFERGGSLVIVPMAGAGVSAAGTAFLALDAEGNSPGRVQMSSGIGRLGPLRAGSYRLQVTGKGIAVETVPFTIERGVETKLDLPLRAGVAVAIECRLPPDADSIVTQVEVADASGVVVRLQTVARAEEGGAEARQWLARTELGLLPGSYRVTATTGALRGSAAFEVGGQDVAVKVDLRRQ